MIETKTKPDKQADNSGGSMEKKKIVDKQRENNRGGCIGEGWTVNDNRDEEYTQ